MPWIVDNGKAMYGADWSGLVKTQTDCSPAQARRIACSKPDIDFFFFCRDRTEIDNPAWSAPRIFNAGDAVFFRGNPSLGPAPECDVYQKDGLSVAYVGDTVTPATLSAAGEFVTGNGLPGLDIVCIFAANINSKPVSPALCLAPDASRPEGSALACGNPNILETLKSDAIRTLQKKGITVLLTFMNNWDDTGWSQFSSPDDAQQFAGQLQYVVDTYGLDGIDIDDEYSKGRVHESSLVMVTSMLREAIPGKIISKALFADASYFRPVYNSVTLAQTLTYGWEMSYGGPPADRLPPYLEKGMNKNALSLGFTFDNASQDPSDDARWLKRNGYAGVMVFGFSDRRNQDLLRLLIDSWSGVSDHAAA